MHVSSVHFRMFSSYTNGSHCDNCVHIFHIIILTWPNTHIRGIIRLWFDVVRYTCCLQLIMRFGARCQRANINVAAVHTYSYRFSNTFSVRTFGVLESMYNIFETLELFTKKHVRSKALTSQTRDKIARPYLKKTHPDNLNILVLVSHNTSVDNYDARTYVCTQHTFVGFRHWIVQFAIDICLDRRRLNIANCLKTLWGYLSVYAHACVCFSCTFECLGMRWKQKEVHTCDW